MYQKKVSESRDQQSIPQQLFCKLQLTCLPKLNVSRVSGISASEKEKELGSVLLLWPHNWNKEQKRLSKKLTNFWCKSNTLPTCSSLQKEAFPSNCKYLARNNKTSISDFQSHSHFSITYAHIDHNLASLSLSCWEKAHAYHESWCSLFTHACIHALLVHECIVTSAVVWERRVIW